MFKKNILLPAILLIVILYSSFSKATNNLNITVVNGINFGKILYKENLGVYTINSNALQSLSGPAIDNSNPKLATIVLQGIPNKAVDLSFSGAALQGAGGSIAVTGVSVYNNSNKVILDNSGYAKIFLNGVLNINQTGLNGTFKGNITIWANYTESPQTVQQDLVVTADLLSTKDTTISHLLFGTIYPQKSGNCTVTLSTSNAMTTTCTRVEGQYSANIFTVNTTVALPLNLIIVPTSATLTGPGGAKLTANNFKRTVQTTSLNTYKITVGATLTVPSNTVPGLYTGQYNVNILL